MEKLKNLLQQITALTLKIEQEYPELYRYLDENPLTIPKGDKNGLNFENFLDYLNSLKELLNHYVENHKI